MFWTSVAGSLRLRSREMNRPPRRVLLMTKLRKLRPTIWITVVVYLLIVGSGTAIAGLCCKLDGERSTHNSDQCAHSHEHAAVPAVHDHFGESDAHRGRRFALRMLYSSNRCGKLFRSHYGGRGFVRMDAWSSLRSVLERFAA